MLYRTDLKVKYYDIEQELILKYNQQEPVNKEECKEEDYYTLEDITDICTKLYLDEYVTVFNAENIFDDIIDMSMKALFDIMLLNNEFKEVVDQCYQILIKNRNVDLNNNQFFLVFVLFFQKDLFYKIHPCICQQLINNHIDTTLLDAFKLDAMNVINTI